MVLRNLVLTSVIFHLYFLTDDASLPPTSQQRTTHLEAHSLPGGTWGAHLTAWVPTCTQLGVAGAGSPALVTTDIHPH